MKNNTILDTWYHKLIKWYVSKPWYIKLLGIGLLIIIALLFVLRFLYGELIGKSLWQTPAIPTANPTEANDKEEDTNEKKTLELKKQLLKQIKDSNTHQGNYRDQDAEINAATTMEELDALREKFNL